MDILSIIICIAGGFFNVAALLLIGCNLPNYFKYRKTVKGLQKIKATFVSSNVEKGDKKTGKITHRYYLTENGDTVDAPLFYPAVLNNKISDDMLYIGEYGTYFAESDGDYIKNSNISYLIVMGICILVMLVCIMIGNFIK